MNRRRCSRTTSSTNPQRRAYNPDIGPEVDAIVLRALQKSPHDRYPSAATMITDIDRVLESNEARANPSAVSAIASVGAVMELPYWPALTVLARTREVRRHRLIRSVSAVAAACYPLPASASFICAALVKWVAHPRLSLSEVSSNPELSSQELTRLSFLRRRRNCHRAGSPSWARGSVVSEGGLLSGDQASRSVTSVVAIAGSAPAARLAPVTAARAWRSQRPRA